MEDAKGKAERILYLLDFIRHNNGKYGSNELSQLLGIDRDTIRTDLQLAHKYNFVESKRTKGKERKYFYLG